MTPPRGYESTAVWEAFVTWCMKHDVDDIDFNNSVAWDAFRDGYSAGLAEEDK